MIRIAIQAKGRLMEESTELLREAGITIEQSKRKLLTQAEGFPLEALYLRDDDIPHSVAMGAADIGIVGLNEVMEKAQNIKIIKYLGFGKCRLSLAIPKQDNYTGVNYFQGKRIATSYPVILRNFLEQNGVTADIHEIAGSVEISPAIGIADAIFDIVSSGGTLVSNGLKEVEKVLACEAVLVANPDIDAQKQAILDQLLFRFEAVQRSVGMKYLLMNLPKEKLSQAVALMPGMKSPTVLELAQPGWCSLHVVVREQELWDKINDLKAIGAEDILVLALEKMIK